MHRSSEDRPIYANNIPAISHHWKVSFIAPIPTNNPSFPGSNYTQTMMVGMIADTIDECLASVRALYPGATIYTVSHQGKLQLDARAEK